MVTAAVITRPAPAQRPAPAGELGEAWRLVEAAKAGDMTAVADLYRRYNHSIFRFAFFRVRSQETAEDIAQETWARALSRIGGLHYQGRDPLAWLFTIARNLVVDYFKSSYVRHNVPFANSAIVSVLNNADDHPEVDPELAALAAADRRMLAAALPLLSDQQQQVIRLRFFHGLDTAETAAALGIHPGAVKALQYRAIRALARLLLEESPC